MKNYNNFKELFHDQPNEKFGITVGSFDGVHRGHQKLITSLVKNCKETGLKSVVMTFYPHPREILESNSEFLMFNERARREFISELGVDYLVVFAFNRDFSTLSADEFLNNILFVDDKIKLIHVGHDFFFGSKREGDFNYLKNYISKKEIEVILSSENEFKPDEKLISSTEIRRFIKNGELEEAGSLLGRPYFLEGLIVKGDGRGKTLGFPTANFVLDKRYILPKNGVYVSKSYYNGMVYHSVTNVGTKPTFNIENSVCVETNIFDFDQDIYGEELRVEFYQKIREEVKFSSSNELISQIKSDVEYSRRFWVEKMGTFSS